MFYVIPDTLLKVLKVALNTNKTGHHVLHGHTLNIVDCWTGHHVSLNTNKTGHHVECRTPIKNGHHIPDTLLKVLINTNKTGHHVLRYTWHIVESVVKHQ